MDITLSPQTRKLLDEVMKASDYASPDEAIRVALETLDGELVEELDVETQAAIDRADTQGDLGEGIPLEKAFDQLRRKHLGT